MTNSKLGILGWREWVGLPEFGISTIRAKLDTGAKTSALHATQIQSFKDESGQLWVSFVVEADQAYPCKARVKDQRSVKDSSGHSQLRYVIETNLQIAQQQFPIELGLTDRQTMRYPLLLGRTVLMGRFLVDSQSSFTSGGSQDSPPDQFNGN